MVAGIGCRQGVSVQQVEAAIDAAIAALEQALEVKTLRQTPAAKGLRHGPTSQTPRQAPALTALATPASKSTEPGIRAAAANRGIPLLAISQSELEATNAATSTRSAHSLAALNVHSAAEAAALAGATALTPGMAPRLLQPRVVAGPVTCALADTTTE